MISPLEKLRSIKQTLKSRNNERQIDQHASATTVFDRGVAAKDPQFLDNHLNGAKTVVKLVEAAPKLL